MDVTTILGLCLFTVIFMIGVPGNSLIVWVFARKSRKTSTAVLILSLASVDLTACLISPVHLMRALGGNFINGFMCKCSIYGSRLFSFSALYLTTCIAMDRYMAICRPLETRPNTRRILAVILLSIALAALGNFQFVLYVRALVIGSVPRCIYRGGPGWLDLSNEIFTSISFLLVLVACTCVYVRIYLEIRKQMKVRAAMSDNGVHLTSGCPGANLKRSVLQAFIRTDKPSSALSPSTRTLTPTTTGVPASSDQSQQIAEHSDSTINDRPNNTASGGGKVQETRFKGDPQVLSAGDVSNVPNVASGMPSGDPPTVDDPSNDGASRIGANGSVVNGGGRGGGEQASNRHRQKKEHLMTRMLLGSNLILILSWLPSFILTNVPDEQVTAYRAKASQGIVVNLSYQLRTLNHIVSIFVYALLNENFRRDCATILRKCPFVRHH